MVDAKGEGLLRYSDDFVRLISLASSVVEDLAVVTGFIGRALGDATDDQSARPAVGSHLEKRPSLLSRLSVSNLLALVRYCNYRCRFPHLRVGLFFIERGAALFVHPRATVRFGRRLRIMRDFTGWFCGDVSIGNGVFFNRGCHVSVQNALTIGDHCLFGEMVAIHDENHIPGPGTDPILDRGYVTAPITIGDNVWVGAKATILSGVTIGDNAVIGANAVVTRDVPPYSIAVGIPARVIRTFTPETQQP